MSDEAKPEQKRSLILPPSRHKGAEYERNEWVITAEQGTMPDDLLEPGYWAHVSEQLKPYDHIEARVDDGQWLAKLLVLEASRNWARVSMLDLYDLTKAASIEGQAAKHVVEFKGPHLKHCVIRTSDRSVVKDGISSKADAISWMIDHERKTG